MSLHSRQARRSKPDRSRNDRLSCAAWLPFRDKLRRVPERLLGDQRPTLTYPMQGLQIQPVIALDRYEAHLRPPDCLRDRFGVNVVALVRLDVRLQILCWHQPYLMTLFSQSPP